MLIILIVESTTIMYFISKFQPILIFIFFILILSKGLIQIQPIVR
jgi:hypothetical protein